MSAGSLPRARPRTNSYKQSGRKPSLSENPGTNESGRSSCPMFPKGEKELKNNRNPLESLEKKIFIHSYCTKFSRLGETQKGRRSGDRWQSTRFKWVIVLERIMGLPLLYIKIYSVNIFRPNSKYGLRTCSVNRTFLEGCQHTLQSLNVLSPVDCLPRMYNLTPLDYFL